MTPSRPYLLRAMYEWILDNGMTPYVMIDTKVTGTDVPREYIENDQTVLNIHPDAVKELVMDNKAVSFSARFGGKAQHIYIPVNAVTAVYARESGKGLAFPPDENDQQEKNTAPEKTTKPFLKVIK